MINLTKYRKWIIIVVILIFSVSISKSLFENHSVSVFQNRPNCVPIIMYHNVIYTKLGKDNISPYEFESDLKFLEENNYHTIFIEDLINYVYYDEELPENPIILSFDDGYISTYKNVFPLLKKYDMKIVLSIIGKSTDDFSRVADANTDYSHMTWDQIKEMKNSGLVEIQNHSYNLHRLTKGRYGCSQKVNEPLAAYEEIITEDVTNFTEKTQLQIDSIPNTFTYPYGKYNDNTDNILKKLGFKATLSCTYGVNIINKDPECLYELKRICRAHNQGIANLLKKGMETIKYSDELH